MNTVTSSKKPAIPARIVIGVTGHRNLNADNDLVEEIRTAIGKINQLIPILANTTLAFTVLSSLAEGADRCVAQVVLQIPNSRLEAVLPFQKEDYLKDFKTIESKNEFEYLLSKASRVEILPPSNNRTEAYDHVGRYVVDHCDILIAIWKGRMAAGRGGTQEIVQYARDINRPLIWINPENPSQIELELSKLGRRSGLYKKAR